MLRNYLKIAFRNLWKNKIFSMINIFGLAIGMACSLLILMFIQYELSFDKFHKNADNIYRLVVNRQYPGRATGYSMIPQSYAGAVKQEFSEVVESVRVFDFLGGGNLQIKIGDKRFDEKRVLNVDSNYFKIFSAVILAGDSKTALNKPNTVVLNATTAKKYFGTTNAVGKIIQIEGLNNPPLEVTAICEDYPDNSHFTFDLLISTAGNKGFKDTDFVGFAAHTYLLLNPNTTAENIEAKFPKLIEKYASGDIERRFGQTYSLFQSNGNGYHYYLQPLKKIYLTSHLEAELRPTGSQNAVYIFGIVAIFILLIACVNFINLSTARSTERAKEVGLRKTFGSEKQALVTQFLTESTLLSFISIAVSVIFVYLLLPVFNWISGRIFSYDELINSQSILILLGFTILVGFVAGIYPALVLSSFKPNQVLKGKFKSSSYGIFLRNGLVIFQFSISIILIICTLLVNSQMQYMMGDKLGFEKEQTIIIERTDLLAEKSLAFKDELMQLPQIKSVSGASALPGFENYFGVSWQAKESKEPMTGRGIIVDDQYQKTLALEIKEGRFFSRDFSTDSLAVVLNEKAVKELGLTNPIGAKLISPEGFYNAPNGTKYEYTVVGILKDYHFQSLHQAIAPLVFTSASKFNNVSFITAVHLKSGDYTNAIASLETKWKEFVKDRPFHYSFLDQNLQKQYQAEKTTQQVFSFFSSLAIFIACIGLLGLAAYTIQQKTREIGIRKVLGASIFSITTLLSKDFLKLVLIAILIASPIAYYLMYQWLQNFAYKVDIKWWIFVLAAIISISIAILTIGYQAIKAALMNPVKSLRSE